MKNKKLKIRSRIKWALTVYRQYMKVSFYTASAYRMDFLLTNLISFLSNMGLPLVTILIYSAGASIPGWDYYEALLIQGVFMLCTGICAPFFYNMVWITMEQIREGTYDLLMLKPGSTIFITIASSFDLENVGMFIGGVAIFVIALFNLPVPSVMGWLQFLLMFFMGTAMTLGLISIMAATAFKWVGNSRIFEIFDAVTSLGRYPGTIFGKVLSTIISYIIPIAMLGFFPASALLGRATWEMLAACVPCILFMLFGFWVFKRMTYLYQSAGG